MISIYDVFTPTVPAGVNYVERPGINDRFVNALRTPGRQVVVYGESGSGKSTLAERLLERLYEGHVISRCTSDSSYDDLLRDAFDQLDHYYVEERSSDTSRGFTAAASVSIGVAGASSQADRSRHGSETAKRMLPPERTVQSLGSLLGAAGFCWVIEDLHRAPSETREKVAEWMKLVSDLGRRFPALKVVVIGAVDSPRDIIHANAEMRHRVGQIHVPLMSSAEIQEVLLNGAALLNCQFDDEVLNRITGMSNGLPSVAHHLGLSTGLAAGLEDRPGRHVTITTDHFKVGVRQFLEDSSDTLTGLLEAAIQPDTAGNQTEGPRLVLATLASASSLRGLSSTEVLSRIRSHRPEYRSESLTQTLNELCSATRGNVITETADGRYRFADPIFLTFVQGALRVWEDPQSPLTLRGVVANLLANWARSTTTIRFTDEEGLTYLLDLRPET
jgi:energy-coupling factor transporter ATP-binding protein EcfA2